MKLLSKKSLMTVFAALLVCGLVLPEASARGGGGGGGGSRASGGGGARASGGGGAAARTSISGDVNRNRNINADRHRDIDIDVDDRNDWVDDHPVGAAVAVAAVTSAVIGSTVYSIPPSCSVVVVNSVTYQQCGSVWYEPRYVDTSIQYVVVDAPH